MVEPTEDRKPTTFLPISETDRDSARAGIL